MYELIQVSEQSYYIQSPAKIGLVKLNEQDVCLIDSGNDKDAGRKVRQILDANGWRLTAIYNTHSNADHIGGNKYLQGQTGCKIYAPGIDCAFTRYPVLEPLCFETILQKLFADYGLTMNFEQYALVGSTVRSYLAWLKDTGKLTAEFEHHMLLWHQA